ncbi:MAG: hypothetical protein NC305_13140 [Lachnospiraceae bacterium]|nr:hypothetical protein [Lachnospiraceae bacterium]
MKKSKNMFLILAILYVFIVVFDICNFLVISENVLVGLSFSAFLMSLGDVYNNWGTYRFVRNELRYICLITTNILREHISDGNIGSYSGVNINNLVTNIKLLENNYKLGIHPSSYYARKTNRVLHIISALCFVLAITVFVLTPFFSATFDRQISVSITLLAFSIMCLNIFITERIDECMEKRNNFMNNTQIIVNSVVPDFSMWLNTNLYYYEDLAVKEEK